MAPVPTAQFEELWQATYADIIRLLRSRGCSHEDAEDAAQETALYVVPRLEKLPKLTKSFLLWIAVQRAKNAWRDARTQARGGGGEISVGGLIDLAGYYDHEE